MSNDDDSTRRLGVVLQHLGKGRYLLLDGAQGKDGKVRRGVEIEGSYETIRLFFEGKFGHADELELACQEMDAKGHDRAYFSIFGVWLFGEAAESKCMAV